jgi:hypothetical protein
MPIKTDLNVSPYFDDFNEDDNYHRILFRPATAVQARELTQLQTILQNQIEKFGNWAFKNGDVVDGCSITPINAVPYIRLQDFQANSAGFDPTDLANTQAVSSTTGLTARVIYSNTGLAANYPDTNIVYLDYSGTGNNGATTFSNNEQLTFYKIPRTGNNTLDVVAIVNTFTNSTVNTFSSGNAYGISVSDGTVFLNGNFVKVVNPSFGLVNTYGTYAANQVVGFQLTETIITENQDPSILDNALGYPNENAPGAHRLQLTPTLVALDANTAANTDGFNPIAVFNYGSLVQTSKAGANLYSIVNDVISLRTYEESGNYVVNPFIIDTITNAQTNNDVGSNSAFVIDANTVLGRINPGIGYAQGSRVVVEKTQYISMRRGIDTQVNEEQQITFNYGGYFSLTEVAGSFPFGQAEIVQLYDTPQQAVTTRKFSSLTPSGNNIGTAMMRCFSYISGDIGSNTSNYSLHVFNVQMANGYNTSQIRSVYYNGSPKGVADLTTSGTIGSVYKQQLFTFGSYGLKTLKDGAGDNNSQYTYRYKVSGSMTTTGNVAVTVPSTVGTGNTVLPYGIGILPESEAATITLVATSNVDSSALTGTVTYYSTNNLVTGSSTSFTSYFSPGDLIKVGTDIRRVVTVGNNTNMTVDAGFSSSGSGANHYKSYVAGQILPISLSDVSKSYVYITDTQNFTIVSGQIPSSTLNVDVVYDVLRTKVSAAGKIINKNRFVKIDTTTLANASANLAGTVSINTSSVVVVGTSTNFVNNFSVGDQIVVTSNTRTITSITNSTYLTVNAVFTAANASANYYKLSTSSKRGPWCLGFSDIHKVTAVYGSSNASYTTSGSNITKNFVFDTGQRDTHYDLGYLYTKPGYDVSATPYLLVQLDYFGVNNTPGVGYFTVDSYPIDDANTANTNAIQTKDIPLYVTEGGEQIPLRDYVDFRPPCNITANNTGSCNTANATQVTAAISYATVNPSSTLALNIPGTGIQPPSYGRNFEADYTFYLPRKDIIYITPDNKIKVKEGLSSIRPQTPLYPDNSMTVSVINVPPYPSLSTDQVDAFLTLNQSSINLIRDTRLALSTNLVTNKRYTMRDIGKLDQRITNLEYYASLSLLEKKATDMTVTDANGLNRFKNGIFVEPFNDYTLCDPTNPEHRMVIDTKKGIGRPKIGREVINIEYNNTASSGTTVKTGRLITLPYTEKPFLIQPYATKYRSSALVAYAWNGTVRLIPAYDNHQDQNNTGSLNITIDATKAWSQFAESPFGQTWGDWQTNTTSVSTSVVSGTSTTLDLGFLGAFWTGPDINLAAAAARENALSIIHQRYGNNVTIGKLVLTYQGRGQEFVFTDL